MKSILYVGAVLMAGASIYGFADYKKTSQSKEFQSLYQEKEKAAAARAIPRMIQVKNVKTEVDLPVPVPEIATTDLKKMEANKNKSVKKKTNRKLNYKQFSRAPLKEEVLMEESK